METTIGVGGVCQGDTHYICPSQTRRRQLLLLLSCRRPCRDS